MGGGIEEAVEVSGVVEDADVALGRGFPFDEGQNGARMGFEGAAVAVDETQDGRADGEDEAGGIEAALGQDMVNEPAVDTSVSVFKRVDIDETKRGAGRSDDGIKSA